MSVLLAPGPVVPGAPGSRARCPRPVPPVRAVPPLAPAGRLPSRPAAHSAGLRAHRAGCRGVPGRATGAGTAQRPAASRAAAARVRPAGRPLGDRSVSSAVGWGGGGRGGAPGRGQPLGPPRAPLSSVLGLGRVKPSKTVPASQRRLEAGHFPPPSESRLSRPSGRLWAGGECRQNARPSFVHSNRNGARQSRLDKVWQRVFFCNVLKAVNTTLKVRNKNNNYKLKIAACQILENILSTLS